MKQRSRIIKPEFFQNRKLAEMSAHHRLLFIGLWTIADRDGKLQDDPDLIKAMVFPFETIDVDGLLAELSETGFIDRYNGGEYNCIIIPKFLFHQKPHWNETESQLPEPQENTLIESNKSLDSSLQVNRSKDKSKRESKRRNQEIPFEKIVLHLNHLTGKGYRWKSKFNQGFIRARWAEGYCLDDFYYVNQVKAEKWLGTEQEGYLRPQTLYGTKMESYRQERHTPRQYSEKTNKALVAAALFLKNKGVTLETSGLTEIDSNDAEVTECI